MKKQIGVLWVMLAVCFAGADESQDILKAAGVNAGLVVQLDSGARGTLGTLAAELGRSGRYLVRCLVTDEKSADQAREIITDADVYGRVSVGLWDGKRIPFMDNLVNLVIADRADVVSNVELMRVLAPGGTAVVNGKPIRKPVPSTIDEWTHFLHGPDNNAVARDSVVGPPSRLQWLADPIHLRSHEHLNSISAVVSAGGRIFYIIDEGPTSLVAAPPKWRLVARDAYNGLLLWKQDIGPWEGHFRVFRSGPTEIARRLVAVGDRVYVTLGYGKKVAAFDAVTGKQVLTYNDTDGALEILCDAGKLFVAVGNIDMTPPADVSRRYDATPAPRQKGIVALDAKSGKLLWTRRDAGTSELMPATMAVSDGRLFFQNTKNLVCMDVVSGKEKWRADRPVYTKRRSWGTPVVVASGGVVLSADGSSGQFAGEVPKGTDQTEWVMSDTDIRSHPEGEVIAFDAETGRKLWTGNSLQGFCNPGDMFVVDGRVWSGADVSTSQALLNTAVDLKTGAVLSSRPNNGLPVAGHTRCYRSKATEKYLLLGDVGVDFIDVNDWSWNANPWVRGTCQYGIMPCNGLLYVPSDSCACRPESRLHGFSAMAPAAAQDGDTAGPKAERLIRGAAYGKAAGDDGSASGWATYRADAARSGRTKAVVPSELKQAWKSKIGGRLTALTSSGGKVFVSRIDVHTVYALAAESGNVAWSRTVGGIVDSPPTVWKGYLLFGCRDGYVYCLRASDGELAWKFRAAPKERFIVAMENVESAWPVPGAVLVNDGLAWFAAGRSSYLDGGIYVYALDAGTGKLVVESRVNALPEQEFNKSKPETVNTSRTEPSMPDILSASDGVVYMRWMGFDSKGEIKSEVTPHLFSATGFLDDSWWHRTYWQYGTWMSGGFGGWPKAAQRVPAGRMMVDGGDNLFGFGRTKYDSGNGGNVYAGHIGLVKQDYQDSGKLYHPGNPSRLFSARKTVADQSRKAAKPLYNWEVTVPLLVRGMVLAGETLFIAGPAADEEHIGLTELGSDQPGTVWSVSPGNGSKLGECNLGSAPVLDGIMAVDGRLLVSCIDGTVRCLSGK